MDDFRQMALTISPSQGASAALSASAVPGAPGAPGASAAPSALAAATAPKATKAPKVAKRSAGALTELGPDGSGAPGVKRAQLQAKLQHEQVQLQLLQQQLQQSQLRRKMGDLPGTQVDFSYVNRYLLQPESPSEL
ncbi:hypothetical protein V8C86DRAFT_3096913 [Haematococcus lacustris]